MPIVALPLIFIMPSRQRRGSFFLEMAAADHQPRWISLVGTQINKGHIFHKL
jgi:hypothetical protein